MKKWTASNRDTRESYLARSKHFCYEKTNANAGDVITEVELNQTGSGTWPDGYCQWQLTVLTVDTETSHIILQKMKAMDIKTAAWIDNGDNITCHGERTPSSNTMSNLQDFLNFLNLQDFLDDEIMQLLVAKMQLNIPEKIQQSTIAQALIVHEEHLTATHAQRTIDDYLPLIIWAQAAHQEGNSHAIPNVVDHLEHSEKKN